MITPNCGTVNNRVNYFLLFQPTFLLWLSRPLSPARYQLHLTGECRCQATDCLFRLSSLHVWAMQVGTKRVFWRKKEKNIVNRDNNMFAAVLYYADIQRIATSRGWSKGTNVWVRRLFVVFQVLHFDSALFVFNQVKKDMFIILKTKTSHLVEYMLRSLITIQ